MVCNIYIFNNADALFARYTLSNKLYCSAHPKKGTILNSLVLTVKWKNIEQLSMMPNRPVVNYFCKLICILRMLNYYNITRGYC